MTKNVDNGFYNFCLLRFKYKIDVSLQNKIAQIGFVVSFEIVFILICSSMFEKVLA